MLILGACAGSAAPLNAEAARQFDIANNLLADLTVEGSEVVPREQMVQAAVRAQQAGTTLRIAVAAPEGEFVSARSIVDRYGGTAIAYQADRATFEGASRDISAEQLDRAVDAAKVQLSMGASADAFVSVLETEGIDARGRSFAQTLLLWLLIPAALFMLSGAWSYMRARKRRLRRAKQFDERKGMLADWASQLAPELESLREPVAGSPDDALQTNWHAAKDSIGRISSAIDNAHGASDLDLAEMEISRTAIRLRDLRRTVG